MPWDCDKGLGALTLGGKVTLAASLVFFLAPLQNLVAFLSSGQMCTQQVLFELEEGAT